MNPLWEVPAAGVSDLSSLLQRNQVSVHFMSRIQLVRFLLSQKANEASGTAGTESEMCSYTHSVLDVV